MENQEQQKPEVKVRAETVEILPGEAKDKGLGGRGSGKKILKKQQEEISDARKKVVEQLANEVNGVLLFCMSSQFPIEKRMEAAQAMLAKCSGAISVKYLMKVEPWAEEICAGISLLIVVMLNLMVTLNGELQNVRKGTDKPATPASPAGAGENKSTEGSDKKV